MHPCTFEFLQFSMQREALLTNAVMTFTQLIKEREKILHIIIVKFSCGGAALEWRIQ